MTLTIRIASLVLVVAPIAVAQPAAHHFNKCTACHGMPDPAVAGDKYWIRQIAKTACVVPPAPKSNALRRSLIAYLHGKGVDRPKVIDRETDGTDTDGRLVTNLKHGSILLYPERGNRGAVRLVWDGVRGGRKRTVPAGRYRIRNYRVIKRDETGVEWQIWSSTPNGASVVVRPGERTILTLDTKVHVKPCGGPTKRGDLRVGLMIQGHHRAGVSVIRDGQRVPAEYTIFAGDRPVASGAMRYG